MTLFIGGPLDGKQIEVDPIRNHVEVAIEHPLNLNHGIKIEEHKLQKLTDIFYYKKEVLSCPTTQIPVFVPRSFSCTDVIAALIEGYHQEAIQTD